MCVSSSLSEEVLFFRYAMSKGSGCPPLHSGLCTEPSANVTSLHQQSVTVITSCQVWFAAWWDLFPSLCLERFRQSPGFVSSCASAPVWFHGSSEMCSCKCFWEGLCAAVEIKLCCKTFKGTLQPKSKIESVSPHLSADGNSGEVSLSTKHFWSFTVKQSCSILLNNWSSWRLDLKWKNYQK